MAETFLHDVVVVEFGDRVATALCGGLLQRLGAEVAVVEPPKRPASPESKWSNQGELAAGKRALSLDLRAVEDVQTFRDLLQGADVVITSSDWREEVTPELQAALAAAAILCDVTAFGATGPLSGLRYTDSMMQAFAGLMDTTGSPEGEPTATRIPITECTAALFAAAGILAALRGRRAHPAPQRVEIALFDTSVSLLSTFLPKYFVGEAPTRIGNLHPSMAPWNAYATRDGWLLLCSASDEMWGRICDVIGNPELKHDPRFASMKERVRHAHEADAAIEPWLTRHTVEECVRSFSAAAVPCGPVYTVADVLSDECIRTRNAVCSIADPGTSRKLRVPGALIHGSPASGRAPAEASSEPGVTALLRRRPLAAAAKGVPAHGEGVLAGVRVLEMGSYTTAPLAARNLGALGAYVVKAEPPSGELSRASPPYSGGQSYLCTLSNSDKRSVAVDLRTHEGRSLFATLLSNAHVFVENMKPGVLQRFGYGPAQIALINPRLIYCSISGYGANSPLAERPAMDATIQGMAGIMDLTRSNGVPYKVGVSISDILGGQFALVAILAALEYRERTGRGQFIDLSMQELSAWLTQFFWNGGTGALASGRLLRCIDGYVFVPGAPATPGVEEVEACGALEGRCADMTRTQVVADLTARGIRCACVNGVREVATHPHTRARALIVERPSASGKVWPLLTSPIRLSEFPVVVQRALGAVGEDREEVLRDWGLNAARIGSEV